MVLISAFKMPEVWSIDGNGTISRRRKLLLKHEGLHESSGSASATDSLSRQLSVAVASGIQVQDQDRRTELQNGLIPSATGNSQSCRIREDHGVWGSSFFVGCNEQLIACAKDGELVP